MVTSKFVRYNQQTLDLSQIDRIEITDRHSISKGTYSGYSFGPSRSRMTGGFNIRMSRGRGQSKSRQYGDINFFQEGRIVFKIEDVEDASGVDRLIRAVHSHIK